MIVTGQKPSLSNILSKATPSTVDSSLLLVGCEKSTNPQDFSFSEQSGVSSLTKNSSTSTGSATLHPQNQSGVMGSTDFTDDGTTLTVNGTATGLTPNTPYASLIYDNGSVPGGPEGCEPTIFDPTDPDFLLPTMFVGFWVNNNNGTGTLTATNTNGGASYVPLNKFRTMSIRNLLINGGFGPPAVAVCGEVAEHPGQ